VSGHGVLLRPLALSPSPGFLSLRRRLSRSGAVSHPSGYKRKNAEASPTEILPAPAAGGWVI